VYSVWNRGSKGRRAEGKGAAGRGRDGEQEGSGGGEKGEPRDEVSVGEVVEVGQSGGKRDVWSGTSGDLG